MTLELDGNGLRGSVSQNSEDPVSIFEGYVEGNTVIFKARSIDGDRTITFSGQVSAAEIAFTRDVQVREGGKPGGTGIYDSQAARQFVAKRVPDGQAPAKPKGASPPRQLTVYDRLGRVVRTLGKPGNYVHPAISPDGTRLAVVDNRTGDIWVFDMSTGAGTRVTTSPELDWAPVWSPDGRELAYSSTREGSTRLYRKDSSGTGIETLVYQGRVAAQIWLTDWSGDGRLSFHSGDVLYVLPLNGEGKEVELVREEFSVQAGRFSPDNRLFSYSSDETGQVETYVRPFDTSSGFLRAGPKWKVPGAVGRVGMVQWRRDGKELLYLKDGALNAVDVSIDQGFEAGTPKLLFGSPGLLQRAPDAVGSISRDGQLVVFAVPPQRKERTVAHETLSKYVGTYVADGPIGSAVAVTFDGHQLMYQFQNGGQTPLAAESDTYFFFRNINGDIEFFMDDSGGVTHLLIHQGGAPGPKWIRK